MLFAKALQFLFAGLELRRRLRFGVNSKARQKAVHVPEMRALLHEANEHFSVECECIARIHSAAAVVEILSPEGCGLLQVEASVHVADRDERSLSSLSDAVA